MQIFHGGCHECTQQDKYGIKYCRDCRYYDANWDKPNLFNDEVDKEKVLREKYPSVRKAYENYQTTMKLCE